MSNSIQVADYEYVKSMANQPEKYLVDVRKPNELEEIGKIPHSINIPLLTLEESLQLSNDEFKEKFGREKPNLEHELVFHCRMGGRASQGAEIASKLGFKNVKNYKGSYFDWLEKEKNNSN